MATRLERLEGIITDISRTLHSYVEQFRHERDTSRQERQELRGKVEDVIDAQRETQRTTERIAQDVEEIKPKVSDAVADIGTLTASQAVIRADIGEMKPTVDKIVIKNHEATGARRERKKLWTIGVAAATALTGAAGLIGQVLGWWKIK